jgi:dihydroorotate dehydrogenase electron transfer subunit
MILAAPKTAAAASPGQFVHVRCSETADPLLRRPFSIYDADAEAGTITILYAVVGGYRIAQCHPGQRTTLLGPLGNGFTINGKTGSAVLIGGGVGIAPLLFLGKRLLQEGTQSKRCWACRPPKQPQLLMILHQQALPLTVATNDGSLGACGHVTCLVDENSSEWTPECRVYALRTKTDADCGAILGRNFWD